jgi:small subunit ribosomal protein S16
MATTIRLTRMGRKQRPFYRLVVVDSRDRRDGAYIDSLGFYNPIAEHYECEVDADRTLNWLEKGATLSETARSLLRNEGVLYRWHLRKSGMSVDEIEAKVTEFRTARGNKIQSMKVEAERKAEATRKAAEEAARRKAEAEAAAAAASAAEADESGGAEHGEEAQPEAEA